MAGSVVYMRASGLIALQAAGRVCDRAVRVLLAVLLGLSGCVSNEYKLVPKDAPPAKPIDIGAQQAPVAVVLDTVIVYHGPGSWRKEAYWDEYVLSVANQGQSPVTIESAVLTSALIASQSPGPDPWTTEKQSHKILKDHPRFVVSAGSGVAIYSAATIALASAAFATGSSAAVAGAVVAGVAYPAILVGSGVTEIHAMYEIQKEFNRRRIVMPLQLQPGETRQGSLFFPITPSPQHLEVHFRCEDVPQAVFLDLSSFSGLHLADNPDRAAAPQPTK